MSADPQPDDVVALTLDTATGQTMLRWIGERPEQVFMTADAFEAVVEDRNRMMAENAALREVVLMHELGRRPSQAQKTAAGLVSDGEGNRPL